MTATRDPDRILRAWLEVMPSEAPDRAIAAVLRATAAAPQVRAWPRLGPWRARSNRLSLIAATAVVALALAGGAVLLTGSPPGPSILPTSTPTTTVAPTAPASATTPVGIRGTWVANTGAGATSSARLVIEPVRISVSFDGSESFVGEPIAGAADELTFAAADGQGCGPGDVGRYRYATAGDRAFPESDGTLLGLTALADDCPTRQAVLARTWVHAIDVDSVGGRGVATAFDPMIMVTLPQKTYTATAGPDSLTLDASDGMAFVAVRNPWGWSAPCTSSGGSKVELAPTVAAFSLYMSSLPGVGGGLQEDVQIDGRPAAHLTVRWQVDAGCQAEGVPGQVYAWTTGDPANTGARTLGQGDTDSIYLVEVDGNLFVLQWLGLGLAQADELAVLSTVRFANTLDGS